MIGCFGTYFTDAHDLIAAYADGVFETVAVPKLEQCYVQTNVGWVQGSVEGYFFEEACEVFYVVHLGVICEK